MTRRIYKYHLRTSDFQQIAVGHPHTIRHVGHDTQNNLCLWAEVDIDQFWNVSTPIFIVGTGESIPDEAKTFLGTTVRGDYVWHFYTS